MDEMKIWAIGAWSVLLLIAAGSVFLVLRLRAHGWRAILYVALLVALAAAGTLTCFVGSVFLDICLWGFDIDGKAPPWARLLVPAGTLLGTVAGVAMALLIAHRLQPESFRQDRQHAGDYGDGPGARPASPSD
jgi:hypothetical protein